MLVASSIQALGISSPVIRAQGFHDDSVVCDCLAMTIQVITSNHWHLIQLQLSGQMHISIILIHGILVISVSYLTIMS